MHLILLLLPLLLQAGRVDTIRVATQNLLNYPDVDAVVRNPYFRRTFSAMNPDILVTQEMQSQEGVDTLRNDVLNYYVKGKYASFPFHDGPDTDNALFYKPDKVQVTGVVYISTSVRDIAEYTVKVLGTYDVLKIYSVHLKASSGSTNEQERFAEATILRNHINLLPEGTKFLIVGDFNSYYSAEPALVRLTESQANNAGRAKDPLNTPGNWSGNPTFKFIHTQSPRVRSFGSGTGGGLDDRFDLILTSYGSLDSNIIRSSYTAYGNDGNHFNDSINRLPNFAVPDSIAHALHYAADHLPVYCDFAFPETSYTITFHLPVEQGWNLLALPVTVTPTVKDSLFPNAISPAYTYGPVGYALADTLRRGSGYWIKFPADDTIALTGTSILTDTINVIAGWNIVSSVTGNILANTVTTIPPGILCAPTFYTYLDNYYTALMLTGGKGYWVKACQDGKIVLKK